MAVVHQGSFEGRNIKKAEMIETFRPLALSLIHFLQSATHELLRLDLNSFKRDVESLFCPASLHLINDMIFFSSKRSLCFSEMITTCS